MDFLESWINVVYAVVLWIVVFVLIKPNRIKELLPIGFLGAITLFAVQLILISLGLIRFNKSVFDIASIPLFNPIWGAAAAILIMNYMKQDFIKKVPIILFFTSISMLASYYAAKVGNISYIGKYNFFYDAVLNFFAILLLAQISEGLFGDIIYKNKKPFV